MNYRKFHTRCCQCGGTTTKRFAREHAGKCKTCFEGAAQASLALNIPTRNERIIEHGYAAYAAEEGHYG